MYFYVCTFSYRIIYILRLFFFFSLEKYLVITNICNANKEKNYEIIKIYYIFNNRNYNYEEYLFTSNKKIQLSIDPCYKDRKFLIIAKESYRFSVKRKEIRKGKK